MKYYQELFHTQPMRQGSWIGNLRWYVEESDEHCRWEFRAAPKDTAHSRAPYRAVRDMFSFLAVLSKNEIACDYRADRCTDHYTDGTVEIIMPWTEYGAMLEIVGEHVPCTMMFPRPVQISQEGTMLVVCDQDLTVCILSDAPLIKGENCVHLTCEQRCRLSVSYHLNPDIALETCLKLMQQREAVSQESVRFWNDYLASCPVHIPFGENECLFDRKELRHRQLWHWWATLENMSVVEFNRWPVYLAPDKSKWFGSWSNDSPEALAALSLTNAAPLAREGIIGYVTKAIGKDGIHAWYTHADGQQSFGVKQDPGRFSHGVPCIVHTVDYYIRATGDQTILQADAGGLSVWEKLRRYLHNLLPQRDCNEDGLVECSNLWESGWDDKLGPFFEKQPLSAWVDTVTTGTDNEILAFYKENQSPVTAIVEQVYALWAFASLDRLAELVGAPEERQFAQEQYQKILYAVRKRHWNEDRGFYYDWDVKKNKQNDVMNLDAFYFLYFESDCKRSERVLEKLRDPARFALPYPPTAAADSPGFHEDGYWSGGYWPREMGYVAMGLAGAGETAWGERLILQSLTSASGNQICETLNSRTGQPTTKPVRLAYGSILIAALLHLDGRINWCPLPEVEKTV